MNELPDPLSVSKAEIDVIEQYFGDLLDEVFGTNPRKLQAGTTYQEGDKR